MIISDFTRDEIEYLLEKCNFVNHEKVIFIERAKGRQLDEIAEELILSNDHVRAISRKVNRKRLKVLENK